MLLRITDQNSFEKALETLSAFLEAERVKGDAFFHSKLVFSELVGYVLIHSKAKAEVEGKVENGFVHLLVRSSDCYVPPKRSVCSDVYDESGRGLFLVAAVCFSREEADGGVKKLIRIEE